jgi:cytochrome c-type protein NapB
MNAMILMRTTLLRTTLLRVAVIAGAIVAIATTASAQTASALRGSTPLDAEGAPPPMEQPVNSSAHEVRNYPEQPPLIPHAVEGYQIDRNGNKCLSCHARMRTGESGAPMLSITHFMDREGQVLASVSPRRYFCTQCHVPQYGVQPPVKNDFVDIDTMLLREKSGAAR